MKKIKLYFTRLFFSYKLAKGELIKVDERHRGVGKTTMMVEIATKDDLAIVVGSQRASDILMSINPSLKIIRLGVNYSIEIKGTSDKYINGVLVDESVEPELIRLIEAHKLNIRGGFVQNYKEKGE